MWAQTSHFHHYIIKFMHAKEAPVLQRLGKVGT